MRTIHRDIVGGFVFSRDNYMLLIKSAQGGTFQGYWIVPGGGIEPGESKLEALQRELREEVDLDLTDAKIELIDHINGGESEKTLRDTGETVLVKMIFNDYLVRLPQNAADIHVQINEELAESAWIPVTDLPSTRLGEATLRTLKKLGYL